MGHILGSKNLDEIDGAKDRIDAKRLDYFVDRMHADLEEQVILNSGATHMDDALRRQEVVEGFRNAWNFSISNYSGRLDAQYLQDVAGRLEPKICGEGAQYAHFRNHSVVLKIDGTSFSPPTDRERLSEHLVRLMKVIETTSLHPVEEAILTNAHLVRIQPFEAANKRLANIVMNTILHKNGYFPISLNESQRKLYKNYLGGAIRGFQETSAITDDHTVPYMSLDIRQRQFYEFLAQRELEELKFAEDKLKGLHNYKITLDVKDKGALFAAKKRVASWFNKQKLPSQERLQVGRRELEVTGDIPYHVLDLILRSTSGVTKYGINDNGTH